MKFFLFKIGIPVVLLAVLFLVMLSHLKVDGHYTQPLKTLKTPQQAAVHYGFPVEGKPLPEVNGKFHLFDAFTRAQIPLANHFDSPMGTQNGAFTYNAQGFGEANTKRGGYHLGDDLNGIGGQDTDLGDPVYAAADGLVVYAAHPSSGWGNVVVLAHRLRDGRLIQTLYAHLDTISVNVGNLIGRGQTVGTVGNAGGNYYAHLHYEMREADGVVIGGGYEPNAERLVETLDPTKFAAEYNQREPDDIRESVLKIMLEIDQQNLLNSLKNQMFSQ